jgi:hypothetical protein
MATQHVSGPWRRTKPGASIFDAKTQKAIAHVYIDGEQRIPVADLIATAPELRDTLKALRDWCDANLNGSPAGYHELGGYNAYQSSLGNAGKRHL